MRRSLCHALIGLLAAATASASDDVKSENLFFIKRSKNTNEVHYDAQVENCTWRRPEVAYYWRELEAGPHTYASIQLWEVGAYGFDIDRVSDSEIRLRLKALPDRPIRVVLARTEANGCTVSTTTRINGGNHKLRAVYVYAEENWIGWPTVHYIDILGHAGSDPVFETVHMPGSRMKRATHPEASLWHSGAPSLGRP